MVFDDLYQEIILDHYRHPRNAAVLDTVSAKTHENPTCGDSIKVVADMNPDGTVKTISYECHGCAISTASASMMSELLSGKSPSEAKELIVRFIRVMQGDEDPELLEQWGDMAALSTVMKYPMRVKCATLAWHAVKDAVKEIQEQ